MTMSPRRTFPKSIVPTTPSQGNAVGVSIFVPSLPAYPACDQTTMSHKSIHTAASKLWDLSLSVGMYGAISYI